MFKALQQQFERMNVVFGEIRDKMDRQDERLNELQRGQQRQAPNAKRQNHRSPSPRHEYANAFEGEEADDDDVASVISLGRPRGARNWRRRNDGRDHRDRDGVDKNIGSVKMTIPPFQGKNDLDVYIEWERQVKLVFDCHNYSEEKKAKLVVVSFIDYAIVWWDQLVLSRRINHERPIDTWEEMKAAIRKRFVPSHYYRDLHLKLQSLRQGMKIVEDYH